jgi:crotonobetainyl-CoA:carnitine CoA-transferase CaiB-like acyl-CoA transferase
LINRNKRSVTLDLKTDDGRAQLLRLVESADVLVESFRPWVMARLGLGYNEVLAERNPRLIYATLSGFGQSGPYRDRAGHDLNYLALAGVLGYNVDRQGQPVPPGVQVADLGAGTLAAVAILAAVIARQQTGRGQAVDVSLFGSAVAWLPTLIASLFSLGHSLPPGEPTLAGGLAQYDVYATADGRHVTLGALEPKFLLNFLKLDCVGRPELMSLAAGGGVQRDRLRTELRAIFASRTLAEWSASLSDTDTCFAPVNTLEETLLDPQVAALGLFTSVEHARLGSLPQIAPPFAFSDTPASVRRPPPDLGEHNDEILGELRP